MGNIKLKTKFAGLIIALIAVSLVANLAWTSENKRAQMENELREKGMVLTRQMDAVWEFMASNQDRLEQISYTDDGVYQGLHCAIAGRSIGQLFTSQSSYTTRFVNFNPRNQADEPDAFEARALDAFYAERDQIERMRVKSQDLLRLLANHADRLSRKIANQQAELSACAERDTLRIKGDLLSANMYAIQKGETSVRLQNFYDENLAELEIALDPALTPQQNAQKYYKNYRKAKTAEEKLTEQIGLAQTELTYIDSVFESLALAENERDLNEIRAELAEQGYVRRRAGKKNQKQPALSAPLKFKTSDGFTVLVGRNNRQNDKLTMKDANNNDIWFHTKNIPGSHTVLVTDGKAPTETAMEEAAVLAAQHSRAKDSAQVPVDYTQIRYVSKPQGAKPGMVIYVQYKTVYVDPTTESKAKQQS